MGSIVCKCARLSWRASAQSPSLLGDAMEESYVRMYDEMQGDMQSATRHQAVKIGDEQ